MWYNKEMKMPFSVVKTNNTTNKSFSYSKGNVTLNFTLRTDIKRDLRDFLDILEIAIKEVKEEIHK